MKYSKSCKHQAELSSDTKAEILASLTPSKAKQTLSYSRRAAEISGSPHFMQTRFPPLPIYVQTCREDEQQDKLCIPCTARTRPLARHMQTHTHTHWSTFNKKIMFQDKKNVTLSYVLYLIISIMYYRYQNDNIWYLSQEAVMLFAPVKHVVGISGEKM